MNNNKIGSIAVKTAARPRARFNFSHDVNTTSDFGYVQPLMCKMLVPGSKTTLGTESLVRSAPLVSPVFGRMKAKINHHFVGFSDLIENFSPFLAGQDVSRSSGTFTPRELPRMSLKALSALCLIGAKCTIYYSTQNDDSVACPYATSRVNATGTLPALAASLTTSSSFFNSNYSGSVNIPYFDNYLGSAIAFQEFFDDSSYNLKLPIANYNENSFFDVDPTSVASGRTSTSWQNWDTVELDSADLLYTRPADYTNIKSITFAFKLSSFGKHLRKIFIGCGYQLDLRSDELVSMMPLFAYFKAYFDTYGLTLYSKWETTNCYKLCRFYDQQNSYIYDYAYNTSYNAQPWFAAFWGFVNDLGSTWYTDSQDFVSAHTVTTAVSPTPSGITGKVVDVDSVPHIDYSDISSVLGSLSAPNGHAFIDAVKHGQLDSEYLKKLYIWTNRNTIAGQRIAELLKMQGLGKFVDEQKTNFIGAHEFLLPVSDVTSTADTLKDGAGSLVGEVAGKSVEYNQSKTFSFENDEFGFWVTLFAIIPESGYCQALDKSVTCVEPFDFPRPDFDTLGYEATRKSQVVGAIDWSVGNNSDGTSGTLASTFGYIARGSAFKFCQNICNGDFSLRSTRNGYTTFFLDRIILVGERYVARDAANDTTEKKMYWTERLLEPSKLPTASPLWRYVARFAWLGLYDRIFATLGVDTQRDVGGNNYWSFFSSGYSKAEYIGQSYDHFLMHNIFNMQYYAPMVPVEKSFETYDHDTETPNTSVGKA